MLIISIIMVIVGVFGACSWIADKEEIPSWISITGIAIGGPLIIFGTLLLIYSFSFDQGYYEYKTFNGETGTSQYCYQGRGSLFCVTNGGDGKITVESFRWIRSEE